MEGLKLKMGGMGVGVRLGEEMSGYRGEMVEGKLGLWYMGMRGLGRE